MCMVVWGEGMREETHSIGWWRVYVREKRKKGYDVVFLSGNSPFLLLNLEINLAILGFSHEFFMKVY